MHLAATDIFSLAKGCPKDSEDAGVRAVSARVLVLLVRHGVLGAARTRTRSVCRNLLFDKHRTRAHERRRPPRRLAREKSTSDWKAH